MWYGKYGELSVVRYVQCGAIKTVHNIVVPCNKVRNGVVKCGQLDKTKYS